MFAAISRRYDLANHLLSFSFDTRWRRLVARLSGLGRGDRALDCATGTGDLAFALKRQVGESGEVVGVDFCPEMLDIAKAKVRGANPGVYFRAADLLALPFGNGAFDAATIGFGMRNVADASQALREMARVVRPGGRVLVLETGVPQSPLIHWAHALYCRYLMPPLGGLLSGRRSAYQYLLETTTAFPCGAAFMQLMHETQCFASVDARMLLWGTAWIYRGLTRAPG